MLLYSMLETTPVVHYDCGLLISPTWMPGPSRYALLAPLDIIAAAYVAVARLAMCDCTQA